MEGGPVAGAGCSVLSGLFGCLLPKSFGAGIVVARVAFCSLQGTACQLATSQSVDSSSCQFGHPGRGVASQSPG